MKKYFLVIVISLTCSTVFSQTHRKQRRVEPDRIPTYNLAPHWDKEEYVNLSEIAESVEYIPLEMNAEPGSVLSQANWISMAISENYLILHNRRSHIALYTAGGKYLSKIGSVGKGPGEYLAVNGLMLSDDEKSIWVFDMQQHRLINFSLDNKVLNSFSVNERGHYCHVSGDRIYLVCLERGYENQDSSFLEVMDLSGTQIEKIPLYKGRRNGPGRTTGYSEKIGVNNNKIQHFEVPYDTVFQLNNDKTWDPVTAFNHGPKMIPLDIFERKRYNEEFQPYSFIIKPLETSRFFFLDGISKQRMSRILVDKRAGWVKRCNYVNKEVSRAWWHTGLKNDIDGMMSFWPRATYKDQYLYTLIDPTMILEYIEKNEVEVPPQLSQIKEEDNPVLVKVKLKD